MKQRKKWWQTNIGMAMVGVTMIDWDTILSNNPVRE